MVLCLASRYALSSVVFGLVRHQVGSKDRKRQKQASFAWQHDRCECHRYITGGFAIPDRAFSIDDWAGCFQMKFGRWPKDPKESRQGSACCATDCRAMVALGDEQHEIAMGSKFRMGVAVPAATCGWLVSRIVWGYPRIIKWCNIPRDRSL